MCTLLLFIWNSNCNKFFVSRMQIMLNRWHRPTKLSIACVYWNHMQKPIFLCLFNVFYVTAPVYIYVKFLYNILPPSQSDWPFLKIDVSLLISFCHLGWKIPYSVPHFLRFLNFFEKFGYILKIVQIPFPLALTCRK